MPAAVYGAVEPLAERTGLSAQTRWRNAPSSSQRSSKARDDAEDDELANIQPADAEGKSFFTQVAPCTNNNLFFGSFKKGVQDGELNVLFPYTFTYRMRPTNVKVHIYRDAATRTNWVLVKKN